MVDDDDAAIVSYTLRLPSNSRHPKSRSKYLLMTLILRVPVLSFHQNICSLSFQSSATFSFSVVVVVVSWGHLGARIFLFFYLRKTLQSIRERYTFPCLVFSYPSFYFGNVPVSAFFTRTYLSP